ncbi:hypothetical protein LSTR_LSTR015170 [Laodelphax striatellus]|uniref:Uncharacterized protein n=1 Tax=Laodelphax striatellus TaxID=195883 RepID=A0A482X6M7_LAOST|nr:hypothetical protein LSTR_LSTR015170 [Laodelphax striatellus]
MEPVRGLYERDWGLVQLLWLVPKIIRYLSSWFEIEYELLSMGILYKLRSNSRRHLWVRALHKINHTHLAHPPLAATASAPVVTTTRHLTYPTLTVTSHQDKFVSRALLFAK